MQLMLVIAALVSFDEKVFTISCLYWKMLNVQTVQRPLTGNALLTIRGSSSWSATLFSSVFLHAEVLTVWWNLADWGGRDGHSPFYDLLLLNRIPWPPVTLWMGGSQLFGYDLANAIFRENLSSLLIWALPRMPSNAVLRAGWGGEEILSGNAGEGDPHPSPSFYFFPPSNIWYFSSFL
jgi:hypothetical protein